MYMCMHARARDRDRICSGLRDVYRYRVWIHDHAGARVRVHVDLNAYASYDSGL